MSSWMMNLIFLVVAGLLPFIHLLRFMKEKGKGTKSPTSVGERGCLPPGPQGLPVFGSLFMLGDHPHRKLHQLAKEYGPIMSMKLGLVPTIVVSSPQAAQQFLKTHDLSFASRPSSEASHFISFGRKGMALTPYGPYWRNMRKICTLELLSNLKIESFRSTRREELGHLVQSLKDSAAARHPADLTVNVSSLTTNMTCRMVFGKNYMEESLNKKSFKKVVEETVYLTGAFNMADYVPCIGPLDLQGLRRRMKAANKYFDSLFEKIIDDHSQASDDERQQKDFIDFMLEFVASSDNEFQFDRDSIKAIMLEMFLAGVDTSSTTIDWALSEIIKHPRVMKKAQEELEAVVGMERAVEESDLAKLEYLDMILKETMRIHPVVPLLIPREAMEDCTVDGFHIPKKSRIIVNAWAIGRDPNVWLNPEEFYPERFEGSSVDLKGRDFQLIPFGSGRRSCPGMQLGITVVRLVLAQLVHCFDWELPNGMSPDDLDMTEKFSIVTPRTTHLCLIPAYRLRNDISI